MNPRLLPWLVALLAATSTPAIAADPKPIRALLVTGGCCHDYSAQKEILSKGIAERAHIEFTVVQQGGSTTDARIPLYDKADWAKDFDVVLHDECFSDVKDPSYTARITAPHKAGLPAVVIHCAMHCYRDGTDEWFQFCGVTSRQHGAAYPHEVLNRDAKHPIMAEFGPAWANPAGELYWIEKVWPTAHPLASSKNKENGHDEVCVWTNEFGKGRVFGTTLGHHNQTVSAEPYLDLLTRGTLWACGKLDDSYLKPVAPKLVAVDEAKGKPATASTVQGGNDIKNANDGNPETRWCASDGASPQWWMVDLGKPLKVSGVRVDWESENNAYRHKIEGSQDGKSFRTLADASENGKSGPSVYEKLADQARYVRVTFLGTNQGGWGSIREVQVFGDRTQIVGGPKVAKPKAPADLKIPAGFEATLFAAPPAVNYPVYVAASPGGDVYVSSDKNGSLDRAPHRGSVYRLRDIDGDGIADESRLFVPDVDSPRGLVWDKDRLYLMHPPHLSVFIDKDGDGSADEQKILVKNIAFTFKDRPADHTSNGVTLGIDGWLYLAIGDFGFMEAEGTDGRKLQLRGGGVVRVRPDGTGLEVFSRGTRNILEVGVDPLLNMFSRDNTNDGGGWDIRLHHFSGMEHHGYPSLFQHFGEEIIAPLADYGGGSGCGGLYLSEPGFPDGFGDAMYTADWGRERIFRHKMTPKGATFAADQTEFLSSPRVTDLDVDASSRLYVSSWKNAVFTYNGEDVGYIARVVPKGYTPEPLPDFAKSSEKALISLLESPSHRRRLEAQRELIHRGLDESTIANLKTFAADKSKPIAGRVAAIFAIKQGLKSKASPILVGLSEDPSIREYAIHALADRLEEMDAVPSSTIISALKDANPRVRLQAAIAAGRLGKLENATALTSLLNDSDPIIAHTAVRSLAALKATEACFAVVDRSDAPAAARAGALRALSYLHDLEVVDGLIRRLDAESDPSRRAGLVTALCRLDHREGTWKGDSWGTRPDTSGPYYQSEAWDATPKIEAALKADLTREKGDALAHLIREFGRNKVRISGGIDAVIAQAEKDPTLVPAAVDQLSQADSIPASALPLLLKAAGGEVASSTRSQAVIGLLKIGGESAARAIPSAMARLEKGGDRRDFQKARDALVNSPKLGDFVSILDEQAKTLDGSSSTWADAVLFALSTLNSASPEAREHASKAIEAGWGEPKRRVQMIQAISSSNQRKFADKILASLADPDASVSSSARKVAADMRLANRPRPTGPKIETMTVDAALDLVFKTKGDASLGEQLFTKQNCVNCHTVRPTDPQRGPYLGNIATTYKRRELAEAILMPSKTIAQGFVTNAFALDDGRTLTGFVVQEAADSVTIRDAKGEETKIPTSKIEERAKQATSVMPEGLVAPLTVQEFASLLDYLESLAKAK